MQTKQAVASITPLVQRQPEPDVEEDEEQLVQPKAAASAPVMTPSVQSGINSSRGSGQPMSDGTRTSMESRFGRSFESVRVHDDRKAADLSGQLNALAFTTGRDIFFGAGRYQPQSSEGGKLLAHELTHVLQQGGGRLDACLQRYGTPIPEVKSPTVTTMREYIDLVRRVEAENPGLTTLAMAEMIRKTKYDTLGWHELLPADTAAGPVTPGGSVSTADVTTLTGEMTIALPHGGRTDPSHIVAAIEAAYEAKPADWGFYIVRPPSLSQMDIASWAGDVGSAAGEWGVARPHPSGGTSMQSYMDEYAPEWDLIADVDGVAMSSGTSSTGFAIDLTLPLSDNLERFYYPTNPREGQNRRFHIFCSVEGFSLKPDGVTLSDTAAKTIDSRIYLFQDFYERNDPNITAWVLVNTSSHSLFNPILSLWIKRANDWKWFAEQFRQFVQKNLANEGS